VQIEWSYIASLMTMIFDLGRDESLSAVCMEPERYSRSSLSRHPLKVSIDQIMPSQSLKLAREEKLSELPPLFHNLTTDKVWQKRAIVQERALLLSPFECLTLFLLKSLSLYSEPVQPFFNCDWLTSPNRNEDVSMREPSNISVLKSKINESIMSFFGGGVRGEEDP